jgi:hypothetical protein
LPSQFCPNPLALPQALGEIHAAAVGGQKEEEEPRIRIEERWPISEIIVSWFILRLMKKILFPSRIHESHLGYLIYVLSLTP